LINRWLGGYRTSLAGFETLLPFIPSGRPVSVLDIASGGTDLNGVLNGLGRSVDVTSLDINVHSLVSSHLSRPSSQPVVGTAHALPFKDGSFDIVHLSLFLHHCTDVEIFELLRSAMRIARCGVVVNDLHRHWIAGVSIRLLTRLFSRSSVVRHDAVVSVRRGFKRSELLAFTRHIGAHVERCSWRWAFRWCLCLLKPERTRHE
jgi:ubiquinone/menaquinone biosynthesis C-methylase UbiE